MTQDIRRRITELAHEAKTAARSARTIPTHIKDRFLTSVADDLVRRTEEIVRANEEDMAKAEARGLSNAMLDRLRLDPGRVETMAAGLRQVAALPDPVGSVAGLRRLSNGLEVGRMRVPLGVIAMIYESRPNVTADAAALCLKSGNAVILRGGSEAFESNRAIAAVFQDGLGREGLPSSLVTLVPTTDREATQVLIGLDGVVDLVIPRGGEALIRFVAEHARVPVIRHYKGVCHVYVDRDADLAMASEIAVNAKVQRPGVCNAMETLLVDVDVAPRFLPEISERLRQHGVELRGDDRARALVPSMNAADESDWDAEYLDLVLSVAVVDGIDAALEHVARHGSGHTESIVTRSYGRARRWVAEVDASLVLVNASTRFNDGFALGLGAEIGISTSKLHAYGPMGLEELTTLKWIGYGEGQIRK